MADDNAAPLVSVAAPEGAASAATLPAPAASAQEAPAAASEASPVAPPAGEAVPEPAGGAPIEAAVPAVEPAVAELAPQEKAAEVEPEAEKPAAYADWKVPEGIQFDTPQVGAFNNILGKYGLSQAAGQELLDFGANLMSEQRKALEQHQAEAFLQLRKRWADQSRREGGNRFNTQLEAGRNAIQMAFPDKKARDAFHEVLAYTGMGDHPAFLRLTSFFGRKLSEPSAPGPTTPQNIPVRAADRRYGRQA